MRCFVGVPLDPALADVAERAQHALARVGADVRFTRGGVHLTVKFLGEVGAEQVPEVVAALHAAVSGRAPSLGLLGLGAFPERGAPRVLWSGVGGEVARLVEVAAAVERALAPLGYPTEQRAFSPHWTLGRVRSPRRARELRHELERLAPGVVSETLPHAAVVLYESRLGQAGSVDPEVERMSLE